ncbi:MAG: hypothetical protein LBE85_00975 [Candidatus Accumulibacter sp.]|nr:hypothetical protein [Accumulibacter sp.]
MTLLETAANRDLGLQAKRLCHHPQAGGKHQMNARTDRRPPRRGWRIRPRRFGALRNWVGNGMRLKLPNLNVPLHRRDDSKRKIALMAATLAWLAHRPMVFPQALISFFSGGLAFWFFPGSDFSHRLSTHRIPVVREAWFVVVLVGIILFKDDALV